MKHLLTIHESDIFPKKMNKAPDSFKQRHAARAIVLNREENVALLRANAHNYHKLPGGGVENGENMGIALQRELLEEIGCSAEIITEVGEIIEYRDKWEMKQISHCYLARQIGKQNPPQFTQDEIDDGFEIVWANNLQEAIEMLLNDKPENYDGLFIQRRDSELLKAAQQVY